MGKIEDAIKKINLQIQMSPNDKYRALIGEYIIDQITTEAAAEQILQADGWAREYFGLTANPQAPAEEPKKGVCVSLEDFL